MKRYILIGMLLGWTALSAQDANITLQECLETGLEQNYSVRIVRNTQQITDNNVTAANAGYLPTIGLSSGYTGRLERTETTPREGESSLDKSAYNQTFNAGLNVAWDIFDGFRVQTNYKRLKELQAQGEVYTRVTIEDFVASLTAEYYNYVQQRLRLRNYRYAVRLSKERLRIVEARYTIGSFSRLDLLQARVDFNADSSKYMNQQEMVYASRIRLNELMANPDVNERLRIRDSVILIDEHLQWAQLEQEMLRTNATLIVADHDKTLAELDLKTLQSRNYPYLTATAGYGYTWNRFGSGTTLKRGVLGPNAGVTLGFTLSDGNRRREQRNARIGIENSKLRRQELENSLMADLANFWQAYVNNLQVIELEEENRIAAVENYEIAMERYLLGDLSGIEMREAQQSLLDAEERILTARYNTKLCEISLLQLSGNVLSYLEE